jgi:hypothetical protein
MTNTVKKLLVLCLLALPTVALADVYTRTLPLDIYIDNFSTQSGLNLTGAVDSIGDAPGTGCYSGGECTISALLTFTATSSGFTISDGTTTYLSASYVPGSYILAAGNEVGIEYLVTSNNESAWDAQELLYAGITHTQSATDMPVGSELVFDLHNYGLGSDAYADMTPAPPSTVTPEPATLTLLGSGMLAGLLRKKLAGNKK